jgi:hypothetical protein
LNVRAWTGSAQIVDAIFLWAALSTIVLHPLIKINPVVETAAAIAGEFIQGVLHRDAGLTLFDNNDLTIMIGAVIAPMVQHRNSGEVSGRLFER